MNLIMRVVCPKCEATYELPAEMAARLPASVRCVRCGNTWEVPAPVSQPMPDARPEPESNPQQIVADVPVVPASKADEAKAVGLAPTPASAGKQAQSETLDLPKPPDEGTPAGKTGADTTRSRGGPVAVGLEPAVGVLPVPEPAAAKPVDVEEADEVAELPAPAVRRQWFISLVVLAAVITLILVLHRQIGQAWPPMMRLYQALGLR